MILIFEINRTLLWDSAFINTGIAYRNFVPRQVFTTWGSPALYFELLTNKIEGKQVTQTCQQSRIVRMPQKK